MHQSILPKPLAKNAMLITTAMSGDVSILQTGPITFRDLRHTDYVPEEIAMHKPDSPNTRSLPFWKLVEAVRAR
jgi:hypothetical protein